MMKENVRKLGIALLYELIIVPLLGIITYFCYNRFVVEQVWGVNQGVMAVTLLLFIALNVGCLYFFAKLYIEKFHLALTYHNVTGLISIFISAWGYVYFKTIEKAACEGVSLLTCSDAVIDLKKAQMAFIAFIAYYVLFMVLVKMIKKQK